MPLPNVVVAMAVRQLFCIERSHRSMAQKLVRTLSNVPSCKCSAARFRVHRRRCCAQGLGADRVLFDFCLCRFLTIRVRRHQRTTSTLCLSATSRYAQQGRRALLSCCEACSMVLSRAQPQRKVVLLMPCYLHTVHQLQPNQVLLCCRHVGSSVGVTIQSQAATLSKDNPNVHCRTGRLHTGSRYTWQRALWTQMSRRYATHPFLASQTVPRPASPEMVVGLGREGCLVASSNQIEIP